MIIRFYLDRKLQKEYEFLNKYKNTLVLNYFKVIKLIDLVRDKDEYGEPYWIVEHLDEEKYETSWHSILGRITPLKGKIPAKDYKELVRVWELNEKRIKESEKEK